METQKTRSGFTGKIGFVLAAAGSAVGLGNIWRFPYLAAKYGGGIFLLVYLILAVTLGFCLMTAEIALGRKTGLSASGAFSALDKRFKFTGVLESLVPIIITPYYCVIGGWVVKYLFTFVTGQGATAAAASADFFTGFISQPVEPIVWFLIFLGLTAIVVLLGVEKGVEKVSKVLMPLLVILTIVIAIYSICMPGASAGVVYYLKPDFSKFSVKTVLAAMGQLFYSMSLSMGIMITYGSYMKKEVSIPSSVRQIEIFDTGIAFLAGLMIIPAVFAFSGGDEAALNAGPSLMFITLPQVFAAMPAGQIIGALFFILVLLAALTSSISLLETVVSIFDDRFHWGRKAACFISLGVCLLLGLPSSLGFGPWSHILLLGMDFLDFFDFISNSVIMPIVALLTCIFVGYFIKVKTLSDEVELNGKFREKGLFSFVIMYFAPVCIVVILLSNILSALGVMSI